MPKTLDVCKVFRDDFPYPTSVPNAIAKGADSSRFPEVDASVVRRGRRGRRAKAAPYTRALRKADFCQMRAHASA